MAQLQLGGWERVLDVGCGMGGTVGYLSRMGYEAVGIDHDAAMVSACRSQHPGSVFLTASAAALPFTDHAFDVVLMECVLSLCHDRLAVLREAGRVLRTAGSLILADLYNRTPFHTYRASETQRPALSFETEIGRVLRATGFQIVAFMDRSRDLAEYVAAAVLSSPAPSPACPLGAEGCHGLTDALGGQIDHPGYFLVTASRGTPAMEDDGDG
jgi:ubiquinone/menaquinone biosynthesis C-methylase UbiE